MLLLTHLAKEELLLEKLRSKANCRKIITTTASSDQSKGKDFIEEKASFTPSSSIFNEAQRLQEVNTCACWL